MSEIVSSEARKPQAERRSGHGRGLLFVFSAAVTVVAPLFLPMTAYYLNLLMQASTYAVAVLGLIIVLGYTGQINLAQAAFFGLGAYSVALGTVSFGLPFWPALFVGIVIASVAGVVRAQGTTVLLVEQNAHMALSIGDRGYVLETGRLVAEGNPEALWNNDEVRAAYLGGRRARN
jgi:branched-subunit amino acid ABC-type transport system permease component